MSPTMMIGTLGLVPYQAFSIEDLEEATNSFDSSNLIEDGPQGQVAYGKEIINCHFCINLFELVKNCFISHFSVSKFDPCAGSCLQNNYLCFYV